MAKADHNDTKIIFFTAGFTKSSSLKTWSIEKESNRKPYKCEGEYHRGAGPYQLINNCTPLNLDSIQKYRDDSTNHTCKLIRNLDTSRVGFRRPWGWKNYGIKNAPAKLRRLNPPWIVKNWDSKCFKNYPPIDCKAMEKSLPVVGVRWRTKVMIGNAMAPLPWPVIPAKSLTFLQGTEAGI